MYVIHKFLLPDPVNPLPLEASAVVLYAGRDSRTNNPAIWVLREMPDKASAQHTTRRTFRVVATGEPFELSGDRGELPWLKIKMLGPVRLDPALIFHVFEEI